MDQAPSLGDVTTRTLLVAGAWAVAGVLGVAGVALGLGARAALRR
jgi:hypothetical protein